MGDEERTGSCVVCQQRDPLPELVPCCAPCRSRLAGQLRDIPVLVDELRWPPAAEPFDRDVVPYPPGHKRAGEMVEHLDVLAELIPAGAVAGQSSAPRVAGSRDRAVPISLDATDLLSDARVLNLTKVYPEQREDQIGYLSAAAILDGWCRDFAETRRESVPEPAPVYQCHYLGHRLDWAFTQHDAVDEFAGEVAELWHTLRRAAGLTTPLPEVCWGVQCRDEDCSYTNTLTRLPGSEWIECSECGLLLSEDEYRTWVRLLAAAERKTVIGGT